MGNYRKVLIADVSSIDAKHMQLMLKRRGWEAETVSNTTDLLNYLTSKKYNLVMISDNLTDGSVIEVASKIKHTNNLHSKLPVVAITNSSIKAEKQKLLNAGADYCLTKPVYNSKLIEVIGHIIEQEQLSLA